MASNYYLLNFDIQGMRIESFAKSNSGGDMMSNDENRRDIKPEDFLVNWDEKQSPKEFAGDSMTDDQLPDNDLEGNLDFRASMPFGYPFMHPMHDATLDLYGEENTNNDK
jgi:hypothetical protein